MCFEGMVWYWLGKYTWLRLGNGWGDAGVDGYSIAEWFEGVRF
jgi:hypothetical protein